MWFSTRKILINVISGKRFWQNTFRKINKNRVGINYTKDEGNYDFTGFSFQTAIFEINIFKKNSLNVFVNMSDIKRGEKDKTTIHTIFTLKVVDIQKLLLIANNENARFTPTLQYFHVLFEVEKLKEHERFASFDEQPKIILSV